MSTINVTAHRQGVLTLAAVLFVTLLVASSAIAASARRVLMPCQPSGRTIRPLVPRARPSNCNTLGARDSFSQAANLAQLRWRNWGHGTAMFTEIERGFHLPFSRIPVAGVVFRIRMVRGRRVYTRLRASSQFGTSTVVLGSG